MLRNMFCTLRSKGNITVFLLVIIVFLVAVTSILAIKLFGQQKTTEPVVNNSAPFSQPETTPPAEASSNTQDVLIYEKDAKLYKLDKNYNSTEIATYDGGVYSTFSYDRNLQYVAFLAGPVEEYNGYKSVWPTKVYLHNLTTDSTSKIYELDLPKSECGDGVKGVKVSDDGKFTAITTRNRLILYNNAENSVVKTYDLPTGTQFFCAYVGKAFSPDNTKILLAKWFYEGGGNSILDFSTGEVTETDFSNYVFGKTAHGWVDNETIVYSERSEAIPNDPSLKVRIDFYKVPVSNLIAAQKIGKSLDGSIHPVEVYDGNLVYGHTLSDEVGNPIQGNLLETDLNTGATSVLHDYTNEGLAVMGMRIVSADELYVAAIPLDNSTNGVADLYILKDQFNKIPNTSGVNLGR